MIDSHGDKSDRNDPIDDKESSDPGDCGDASDALKDRVVEVIKTVYDPEIPVDIYELGLIYELDIDTSGAARVIMTLTSPGCPVAGSLPGEVEDKIRGVDGITDVHLELVWDPPWTPDRMSEAARLMLNM